MEFSFDRTSAASQPNKETDPGVGASSTSKPVTDSSNTQHADGIDLASITNERLRKAIERNRAKQAARGTQNPSTQDTHGQASFFTQASNNSGPESSESAPRAASRVRAQERTSSAEVVSSAVTRRSAARPNEADFTPVKRSTRKVAHQISYSTGSSTGRKKNKPLDPTLVGYLVKGAWFFCAVMVLRLIFAHGGVTDFYSHRAVYQDRVSELEKIKKENMVFVREIERMQTDLAFQKKLVRDNLGFIAADEYLVLFPKENVVQ